VLQQTERDASGRKLDMALVDVTTGVARSFSQKLGRGSQSCTVDEQALCHAAGDIAQALRAEPDLVIFSKFGHLELEGRGFRQEFAQALENGLPVLCTIPLDAIEGWLTFTGGQGRIIAADPESVMESLWAWWGPYPLYADLAAAAIAHPQAATACCLSVAVGPRWLMVQGPHGCGVAPLLPTGAPPEGDAVRQMALGQPLAALAQKLPPAVDAPEVWWQGALALAALNALINGGDHRAQDAPDPPLPEVILDPDASLWGQAPPAQACLLDDATALGWQVSAGAEVLLPAWGLAGYHLPHWLSTLGGRATVSLSGAATPVCDRLHAYGLRRLEGVFFPDAALCAQAIADPACDDGRLLACGHRLCL
jgi:hypothetical protein